MRHQADLSGTLPCVAGVLGQTKVYANGSSHVVINEASRRCASLALEPLKDTPEVLLEKGWAALQLHSLCQELVVIWEDNLQAKPRSQTLQTYHCAQSMS